MFRPLIEFDNLKERNRFKKLMCKRNDRIDKNALCLGYMFAEGQTRLCRAHEVGFIPRTFNNGNFSIDKRYVPYRFDSKTNTLYPKQ